MNPPPPTWNAPANLPPCYWIEIEQPKAGLHWWGPFDSEEAAKGAYVWKQFGDWLDKPTRAEIRPEDGTSFVRRWYGFIGSPAAVTARWNWFERHREILLAWRDPSRIFLLIRTGSPPRSDDLLADRIGGDAVLPARYPWPTYRIGPRQRQQYASLDYKSGQVLTPKKCRYKPRYTYVATLDLRQRFSFDDDFPEAVSLFVPTFDPVREEYRDDIDVYQDEGVVVPLRSSDALETRPTPEGGHALRPAAYEAHETFDFPPDSTSLDDIPYRAPPSERERIAAAIDAKEPGSSAWMHADGVRLGGDAAFIQGDPRKLLKNRAVSNWQCLARLADEFLNVGDSGQLYLLAGQDAKGAWHWRLVWDFH